MELPRLWFQMKDEKSFLEILGTYESDFETPLKNYDGCKMLRHLSSEIFRTVNSINSSNQNTIFQLKLKLKQDQMIWFISKILKNFWLIATKSWTKEHEESIT